LREVEIGFERESVYGFSALLVNWCERNQFARCGQVGLFGKFAPCRGDEVIAGLDKALGDGPNAIVLPGPKRPPPGCASRTSIPLRRRNANRPALICLLRRIGAGPVWLRLSTAGLAKLAYVCMILSRLRRQCAILAPAR